MVLMSMAVGQVTITHRLNTDNGYFVIKAVDEEGQTLHSTAWKEPASGENALRRLKVKYPEATIISA